MLYSPIEGTNFKFGASISGVQSEDHPNNNHWWKQLPIEQGELHYGQSVKFEEYYPTDIEALARLGMNAFRFSPLSSRVMPDGVPCAEGIDHYKRLIECAWQNGVEPILTIQHFDPQGYYWFEKDAVNKYMQYAEYVLQNLGPLVNYVIPINEPKVMASFPFQEGMLDPHTYNPRKLFYIVDKILLAIENQAQAHNQVYDLAKSTNSATQIIALDNIAYFEAYKNYPWNQFLKDISEEFDLTFFLDKVADHYDIIGLNYYWHRVFKLFPPKINGHEHSDTNARLTPEHLYDVMIKLADYSRNKPILITEIGVAVKDDAKRARYYAGLADSIIRAKMDGVNLIGALIWSLLDNYEFRKHGWGAGFGIWEVDRGTQTRKMRPAINQLINPLREAGLVGVPNLQEV